MLQGARGVRACPGAPGNLPHTPKPGQGVPPAPRTGPRAPLSPAVGGEGHVGAVVEEDADSTVRELVAEAVLVGIVHPLAHPHEGLVLGQGRRVPLGCREERGGGERGPAEPGTVLPVEAGEPQPSLCPGGTWHRLKPIPGHATPGPSPALPVPGGMEERQLVRSLTVDSTSTEAGTQSLRAAGMHRQG